MHHYQRILIQILFAWVWANPLLAIDLRLSKVSDLASVVEIKDAGDGSQRLFLQQQVGVVRILQKGQVLAEPFIDISGQVQSSGEQGLLSLAFAPNFAANGRFYLYYVNHDGDSVLSRFIAQGNRADPGSEEVLITFRQPFSNHNGGRLEFGPDGMLYLGLGDGGGGGDPQGNAQNLSTLFGKLIRLDVESQRKGYQIPADNPFVTDASARSEIWAYGLRNPWRMAFDRLTGDLYIADVGQFAFEEVNFQAANSQGGENYGWNRLEAESCFESERCDRAGLTPPIAFYEHNEGCSITGGQVYRGSDYPDLFGHYLYGDLCSGRIWSLHRQQGKWQQQVLRNAGVGMFSFGEDQRGDLYLSGPEGVFLLSDGAPAASNPHLAQSKQRVIDGSLSGSYIVDGLINQGFMVSVGENADGLHVFIAWLTYDEAGAPLWLVGNQSVGGNVTQVSLMMQRTTGAGFLNFTNQQATLTDVGLMTFRVTDCNAMQASFDFGSLGADSLSLERLTNIEGWPCR